MYSEYWRVTKKKNILKRPQLISNNVNKITKKVATNVDMEEAEVEDVEANVVDINKSG